MNMAKKKSGKRPAGKKSKKTSDSFVTHMIKVGIGISILIVLVVGALWMLQYFLPAPAPKQTKVEKKHFPTYEIYPKEKVPRKIIPSKPAPVPAQHPDRDFPRTAIIIDDIGYDRGIAEKFIALGEPITLSLLPYGPFTKKIAQQAKEKGSELMLHLPMEPLEYPSIKPGPGGLLTTMAPDDLIAQLEKNIKAVPGIKGVNNHMGSKMTANSTQMYQIFSVLKSKNLYFIDSLTSPKSVGESSARLFKVRFEERDVFLDHVQDPDFVRGQIELLMRIAEKYGTSVGIGHPHEVTYQVMAQMMPEMKKRVRIVPASQLVHAPG